MIPFLDLQGGVCELRDELDDAYNRFMDSGRYVLGQEVGKFEKEYASYCQSGHCVGLGSGLDALTLALRALHIGPGDEVVVPTNTYIATWLAVTAVGATIVPVEPAPETYNITADAVSNVISKRTKVVLAVNLYGQPVNYEALLALTQRESLKLVIDNAQAQGAQFKGQNTGGIADIECHSFYPSKNLGAYGEAGAITTNDAELAEHIELLRNYGSRQRYHNEYAGVNSRLDALQAAFLRVKLKHLDSWNDRRRDLAAKYQNGLCELSSLRIPSVPKFATPAWHLYVVRHRDRVSFRESLAEMEIGTEIHYPIPPHASGAYASLEFELEQFPIANQLAAEIVSLPLWPQLESSRCEKIVSACVAESNKNTVCE